MDPRFFQYGEVFTHLVNMVIYLDILASQNLRTGRDLKVLIRLLPIFIMEKTVSEKPSDLAKVTQLEIRITRTTAYDSSSFISSRENWSATLMLLFIHCSPHSPSPSNFSGSGTNFGFLSDSVPRSEK